MCVSACTQKTPNLRCGFLKRRLTNTTRRHHHADGQLSSLYAPSPSFSSFGAAFVMCSSAPASSSAPLLPSVRCPSIGLVVNILYIRIFCGHLNVLYIFDQTCIVLQPGWSSTNTTARMPASPLVFPCLRLTPRRHRQADDQLSPLHPSSPSFSSFSADCVKLCCLPPPSLVRKIGLCSLD